MIIFQIHKSKNILWVDAFKWCNKQKSSAAMWINSAIGEGWLGIKSSTKWMECSKYHYLRNLRIKSEYLRPPNTQEPLTPIKLLVFMLRSWSSKEKFNSRCNRLRKECSELSRPGKETAWTFWLEWSIMLLCQEIKMLNLISLSI